MNQVKRVRKKFPEAPNRLDRFCQRNERGARSECFSDPEVLAKRIKKIRCLPLSFPALLIFPSNAGRAAAGAEEET